MSTAANSPVMESPCIRVCVIDPVQGLCSGCLRTLDEIARWSSMSAAERRAVMAALPARRPLADEGPRTGV